MPDVPAARAVYQRAAAAVARQRAVAVPQPGGRAPPAPRANSPNAHALLVIVLDDLLQQDRGAQELKQIGLALPQERTQSSEGCLIKHQRFHAALLTADKGLTSTLLAGSRCEVSGREAADACGGDPLTD